jgi:TetR/AcrR family transcriptional regulator, lmrAB and yxaGH operons repressor
MAISSTARHDAIAAAARLFDRQGYHGTGLAQILAESGAPRGSFYFHFPGGKAQLGVEAVHAAAAEVESLMRATAEKHPSPAEMVVSLAQALGRWLERADYSEGCAVAAVTVGTGDNVALRAACRDAYAGWQELVRAQFVAGGVEVSRAGALSTLAISALEGAVILCRAQRCTEPLDQVAVELADLLAAVSLGQ